ncbi:MAG: glycosyltransferase family 8 protein [Candidatus Omnitrophica bacterium]|nr:glycosyltransferase family 8 protein [Candidatus Omnitrophota bacterium]
MATRDDINIVFCCDENLARGLAAAVMSVVATAAPGRRIRIFIVDGGFSRASKDKLCRSFAAHEKHIQFLTLDETFLRRLMVSHHISTRAYYRLLLPAVLPPDVMKVIYLDADLILNADIAGLWDLDLKGQALLAAQEQGEHFYQVSSLYGLLNYRELGLKPEQKYFNSGVLVIDLDQWRRDDLPAAFLKYAEANRQHIRWHDQDILNAVLARRWGELDPRWNMQQHILLNSSWDQGPVKDKEAYDRLICQPYIIHFSTAVKPWHFDNTNPFKDRFFQYLDTTAWKGWRPNGFSRVEMTRTAKKAVKSLRAGIFGAVKKG